MHIFATGLIQLSHRLWHAAIRGHAHEPGDIGAGPENDLVFDGPCETSRHTAGHIANHLHGATANIDFLDLPVGVERNIAAIRRPCRLNAPVFGLCSR